MALIIFAACLFLILYSYLIYPFVLLTLTRGKFSEDGRKDNLVDFPLVSVLVAAHNEELVIAQRIRNLLDSDYPQEKLEIVIASDGSNDATESLVRKFSEPNVRLISHHPNMGKSWTLNRAIPKCSGDIIVLSDANTCFDPSAVSALVRELEHSVDTVAAVGKLEIVDSETGDNLDSIYWRYESFVKEREGLIGSILGANGGIYAIRKQDFCRIPDNTILDDLCIPLLILMRQGGRVLFARDARAFEVSPPFASDEFARRTRIGTGAYQSLALLWPILLPKHGFTAFAFLSHKILRWFTPHLLILASIIAVVDNESAHYLFFLAAILLALILACLGRSVTGDSAPARILRLSNLFLAMNAALFVGFTRWLFLTQEGTWTRTERSRKG